MSLRAPSLKRRVGEAIPNFTGRFAASAPSEDRHLATTKLRNATPGAGEHNPG